MPRLMASESWLPKGVKGLEENALKGVKSTHNALVIAGPGAGKTELLAQRACFLLETGFCPEPKRILAISFKRDAAKNLGERVKKRVGPELSRRFDSMTFDAFAKSIVDRFRMGLPEYCRPTEDYVIDPEFSKPRIFRELMAQVADETKNRGLVRIQALNAEFIYKRFFAGVELPPSRPNSGSFESIVALHVWKQRLSGPKSIVNFDMIGRMADLALRCNPEVLTALRVTYAYIFLDEFQDTNSIHYALTKTAFRGTESVVTAVGDEKQRIMTWAGALHGVFQKFKEDFGAEPYDLKMNYRSARELVRIQSYLISALEPGSTLPEAADDGSKGDGECRVFSFQNHEHEAEYLAQFVHKAVTEEKIHPRDICILTRSLPDAYSEFVVAELTALGVPARVEEKFQSLLAEPVVEAIIHFLKLFANKRAPQSWEYIVELLALATGNTVDDEKFSRDSETRIKEFSKEARNLLDEVDSSSSLKSLIGKCVLFFGPRAFRKMFPQYQQGTYLRDIVNDATKRLFEAREKSDNWKNAIEDFEGLNSVPIMTIHKSKGLEYHTVIFVGLEDSALWGFKGNPNEETCAFFVALSRAKSRVIFTFCHSRPDARNGYMQAQRRKEIDPLYKMLQEAGIEPEEIKVE